MARAKEPIKPMLAVKFDFVASLDEVVTRAMALVQITEQLLKHDQIKKPALAEMLREHVTALKSALYTETETK